MGECFIKRRFKEEFEFDLLTNTKNFVFGNCWFDTIPVTINKGGQIRVEVSANRVYTNPSYECNIVYYVNEINISYFMSTGLNTHYIDFIKGDIFSLRYNISALANQDIDINIEVYDNNSNDLITSISEYFNIDAISPF